MALTPAHRDLDHIVGEFVAPFVDGRFAATGWTLVNWDAEQGICLTFGKQNTWLLLELEARNEQLDCYARTARFNVCVRRQFSDAPLSDSDRHFVDRVIAAVRERESILPDGARPLTGRRAVVREILVDRLLMPEGNDHYYINPYVGCMIACPFCYVIDRADFSRRLDGQPELPWGHYLDVKINAAEVLRREIQTVRHGIVRMSPILTDPYQSAERRFRITRQCLEILLETDLVPVVLTRAPRILDDLDLFRRFRRAMVGFSIPTDDDAYRQIFEPGADPIDDRVEALRALHAAGVRTFVVVQPVLPMNVDALIAKVAPLVSVARLDRLYVGDRVQPIYDAHGLGEYATEAYADRTIRRLTAGFEARGVRVDPLERFDTLLAV